MEIIVNGKKEIINEGITINEFLGNKKIRPEVVTIELNEVILNRAEYESVKIRAGDKLEIVFFMGGGKSEICQRIHQLIGRTPVIKIGNLTDENSAEILAKLEFFNPGGSVKDRIAISMIETAEKEGVLKRGGTVIEATSGNTGIGLAMTCASKGYRCVITMPESMSLERVYILKSYGAEVILTNAAEGMTGALNKAKQILSKNTNAFMSSQFNNPANPDIHRKTTAREIIEATEGKIDAFVAGVGTGGTITGVGEVLKKFNKDIRIIAVEPATSAVLSGKPAGPHKIQGIGAGFIPAVLNLKVIDEIITVTDADAYDQSVEISKKEGISVGISSGAAFWAARQVASRFRKGKTVITVFPDSGERYFSIAQYFNM